MDKGGGRWATDSLGPVSWAQAGGNACRQGVGDWGQPVCLGGCLRTKGALQEMCPLLLIGCSPVKEDVAKTIRLPPSSRMGLKRQRKLAFGCLCWRRAQDFGSSAEQLNSTSCYAHSTPKKQTWRPPPQGGVQEATLLPVSSHGRRSGHWFSNRRRIPSVLTAVITMVTGLPNPRSLQAEPSRSSQPFHFYPVEV
ncbi:uncharacterized protein LOC116659908 isoform X4 [Camelus ferus]|uniref:Uncharacterized protein LOC116659908 isoform X4 n=1 Tax=Camelus ferus TaxID=419612 RepID=A0A8B8S352_CAMFR|nr:uncharacterized protein LOC116659908 isoform X4 [Camelus ferus]